MILPNVFVLTCKREASEEPWPYLHETLRQINAENVPGLQRHLVVDGEEIPALDPGWTLSRFTEPHFKGNKYAYWHVFKLAVDLGGDALILEDDLELCKNAVRRMTSFAIPDDVDWVQFFAPHVLRVEKSIVGLWRPPPTYIQFAQAMLYPARTLRKLVTWSREREWQKFNESDRALGLATERLGLRYAVHAPDLVQHVGAVSQASGNDTLCDWRTSKTYPGRDFDAMALYGADQLFR